MDEEVNSGGNFDRDRYYSNVVDIVQYMLVVAVVILILGYLSSILLAKAAINQANEYRAVYFQLLLEKPQTWYDLKNAQEIPSQLQTDWNAIEVAAGAKLNIMCQLLGSIIFGLGFGFYANAQIALMLMGQLPIIFVGLGLMAYALGSGSKKLQDSYTEAGGIAGECIENQKLVIANNIQEYCVSRYSDALAKTEAVQWKIVAILAIGNAIWMCVYSLAQGWAFWFGSLLFVDETDNWIFGNEIEVADIFLIVFAIGNACAWIAYSWIALQGICAGIHAAQRVQDLMNERDQNPIDDVLCKPEISGSLIFDQVNFSYPSQPYTQVLTNMSFEIQVGQTVAFVGETGSGKSTIICILEKLYTDYSGSITLDGTELWTINPTWLRQHIGLVNQAPVLFETSIKENIWYGRPDAQGYEVIHAAELAGIHQFIMQLPKKYDTKAGTNGCRLSGEQKQRIAIARAILRNPKLLILDEATSSLDVSTQEGTMCNILQSGENRTNIIITQRITTIQKADKIFVIQNGTVAEQGTDAELIEAKGIYFHMTERQAGQRQLYLAASNVRKQSTPSSLASTKSIDSIQPFKSKSRTPSVFYNLLRASYNSIHWVLLAITWAASVGCIFPLCGLTFALIINTFFYEEGEKLKDVVAENSLNLVGLGFAVLVFISCMGIFQGLGGSKLTTRMRVDSFRALLSQDSIYHDKNSKTTAVKGLQNDSQQIYKLIGPTFSLVAQIIFAYLIAIIIVSYYNWRVGLMVLAISPFIAYALAQVNGCFATRFGVQDYNGYVENNTFQNLQIVRAYNLEPHLRKSFIEQYRQNQRSNSFRLHQDCFNWGFACALLMMTQLSQYYLAALDIKQNNADIKDTNAAMNAGWMVSMAIGIAWEYQPDISVAYSAACRLFTTIGRSRQILSGSYVGKISGHVEFRNVSFTYPDLDTSVLNNICVTVQEGSHFSLTGPTGAGKSTMCQLLIRLYDIDEGAIIIDGVNVQDYNLNYLREKVAYVSQETLLFAGTIEENLMLGKNVPEYEISQAIYNAKCDDCIDRYGLKMQIGVNGNQLSCGQRQRLAIARVLLRKPKILLLDESTSEIDSRLEEKVIKSLRQLSPSITIITITHRLATLKSSDMIAVVDSGTIVEVGSPQDLMNKSSYVNSILKSTAV